VKAGERGIKLQKESNNAKRKKLSQDKNTVQYGGEG
jgi:hypothetical protein